MNNEDKDFIRLSDRILSALELALDGSTIFEWQPERASIIDTHVFTVPKISGVEIWVGGFLREQTVDSSATASSILRVGIPTDTIAGTLKPWRRGPTVASARFTPITSALRWWTS